MQESIQRKIEVVHGRELEEVIRRIIREELAAFFVPEPAGQVVPLQRQMELRRMAQEAMRRKR